MGEEEFNDDVQGADVDDLINRTRKAEGQVANMTQTIGAMGTARKDDNFLHMQISTEEMLDKLEHFYRGDVEGDDGQGNIDWKPQENKELVTLNEFGVSSLMEIVTKYIDKNTMLSYYDSTRVFEIMGDIGDELVLFILCNYKKIGMDTYYKKTKYRILVVTTLHIIESTYRRALGGKTLEEMNQSRVIGQFGTPIPQQPIKPSSPGRMARFFGNR